MNINVTLNNRGSPTTEKVNKILMNISSKNTLKENKISLNVRIAEAFIELIRLRL